MLDLYEKKEYKNAQKLILNISKYYKELKEIFPELTLDPIMQFLKDYYEKELLKAKVQW